MNIECSDQPLDVSFHPARETIVAAALVDGTLEVHDFRTLLEETKEDDSDDDDDTILSSTPVHKQLLPNYIVAGSDQDGDTKPKTKVASCRAVHFSHDRQYLYTGGSAGDLCCIDAERVCAFSNSTSSQSKTVLWSIDSATVGRASTSHYNPLHVLHQLPVCSAKGPLMVSGDDQGGVRLWDERLCNVTATTTPTNINPNNNNNQNGPLQLPQGCVLSWKESKDYISALDHSEDGHTLLASSADGSLTVFDIRHASTSNILQNVKNSKRKDSIVKQSDLQDDELLSMVTVKHGRKVVCGTQDGVLALWSWGTWGDISDRYPRATSGSSIDALLKLDESTLLTGSSDGLLRVVSLHPNKVIGALGQHDGFPIEGMEFSATRQFVGSISHDNYIRLWGMDVLNEDQDDGDDEEEEDSDDEDLPMANAPPARGGQASDDEWDDMDEIDEEMDDGNDDSDKGDNNDKDSDDSDDDTDDGAPTENDSRASRLQSKNADFFSDL